MSERHLSPARHRALFLFLATAGIGAACAFGNGCGGDDNGGGSTNAPDASTVDAGKDAGKKDSGVTPPRDSGSLSQDSGNNDFDANPPPPPPDDSGANVPDTSTPVDANMDDGATAVDAGIDAPVDMDAGTDSALPVDANLPIDAGIDAASCGVAPTLHPSDGGAGSVFCPFGPDGGAPLRCDPQAAECCIGGTLDAGGFAASECDPFGSTCSNGANATAVECEDQNDCAAGSVCCGMGTPTLDPVCMYYRGSRFTGTTCTTGTQCAVGSFQVCESNAECPNGQTCTPLKAKGLQIGFCQ